MYHLLINIIYRYSLVQTCGLRTKSTETEIVVGTTLVYKTLTVFGSAAYMVPVLAFVTIVDCPLLWWLIQLPSYHLYHIHIHVILNQSLAGR